MRPRRSCGFACVVLAGTSEGLASPRVLGELIVGVVAPSNLAGSIIVDILHSGEGGDVEQVCSNFESNLPYLRLLISLSCLYILHIVHVHYLLDILVLKLIYAWDCLFALVFNQESHYGTSTLI